MIYGNIVLIVRITKGTVLMLVTSIVGVRQPTMGRGKNSSRVCCFFHAIAAQQRKVLTDKTFLALLLFFAKERVHESLLSLLLLSLSYRDRHLGS